MDMVKFKGPVISPETKAKLSAIHARTSASSRAISGKAAQQVTPDVQIVSEYPAGDLVALGAEMETYRDKPGDTIITSPKLKL